MFLEQATNFDITKVIDATISSNTTTSGVMLDMVDHVNVCLALDVSTAASGTMTLKIETGKEADGSDLAETSLVVFSTAAASSATLAEGANLVKQGVYDYDRYIKASVVSTGVTGDHEVRVLAFREKARKPASQS